MGCIDHDIYKRRESRRLVVEEVALMDNLTLIVEDSESGRFFGKYSVEKPRNI